MGTQDLEQEESEETEDRESNQWRSASLPRYFDAKALLELDGVVPIVVNQS